MNVFRLQQHVGQVELEVGFEAVLGGRRVAAGNASVADAADHDAVNRVNLEAQREVLLRVGVELVLSFAVEDRCLVVEVLAELLVDLDTHITHITEATRDHRALGEQEL